VSRDDERSRNMKAKMKQYLIDFDLVYNKEDPELVISIGGDGTLLEASEDMYINWTRLLFLAFTRVILAFPRTGHLMNLKNLLLKLPRRRFMLWNILYWK